MPGWNGSESSASFSARLTLVSIRGRVPAMDPPLCPTCGQPATEELGGAPHDWECRNEACPEYGQAVEADEPPPRDDEPD